MESLSSGTYGGVGKPGPGGVDLYLDVVEVPQALLGDEAPDDGLEDPGIAAYREVVLLAGLGVRQEDMPVAELLVVELVLLELDSLERAGDGLERGRLAVLLRDDGTARDAQEDQSAATKFWGYVPYYV